MIRVCAVVVFGLALGGFLSFASAQPQPGGNSQPQDQAQSPSGQTPEGGPSGRMKPNGQCKKELETACPDMHPGDGKFGPCVKKNMGNFTPKCKRRIRRMMHRMKHHRQGQGTQAQNGQSSGPQQDPDQKEQESGDSQQ